MKSIDLVGSAVGNTFRSKTRTTLTILAIFVGAFTLTITNGLGTGINRYIDDTVAAMGADDVMTITKVAENATDAGDGPREYDPDAIAGEQNGPPGTTTSKSDAAASGCSPAASCNCMPATKPPMPISYFVPPSWTM